MPRWLHLTPFALGLLSACAAQPFIRENSYDRDVPSRMDAVSIEVTNDLGSQAKIYLVRSSERRMLGTVDAQRTRRFSVPARAICGFDVHLAVAPVDGSPGYTTEEFVARPGQRLTFKLEGREAFRLPDRD